MKQTLTAVGGTHISQQLTLVSNLLQFMPADISVEIAYNRREAALHPHCAVCSLFVPVTIDLHA